MQQKYVIAWTSTNPEATAKRFLASGFGLTPKQITIVESLHVVGVPKGFIVVQTDSPHLLHAAIVSWSGIGLTAEIFPCVGDEEARAALKPE